MRLLMISCLLAAIAGKPVPLLAAAGPTLPKGYTSWAKGSEKVVNDKNSLFYGIHYLYVDKKAMSAYQKGGGYPEGSQFVIEFFNIREVNGKPTKGKKNMVVLMRKEKKQTATGGWLFAGFGADGKPSGVDPVKNCFECHLKEAKDRDFVISKFADFKK